MIARMGFYPCRQSRSVFVAYSFLIRMVVHYLIDSSLSLKASVMLFCVSSQKISISASISLRRISTDWRARILLHSRACCTDRAVCTSVSMTTVFLRMF